jgi:hypothetical protein
VSSQETYLQGTSKSTLHSPSPALPIPGKRISAGDQATTESIAHGERDDILSNLTYYYAKRLSVKWCENGRIVAYGRLSESQFG